MTLKYEQRILEAFTRLGYSPRDNQVEYVDRIVTAYVDEGYTRVIVNAPTGAGKSIIGAVVSDVMHQLKGKSPLASFILMGQNVLAKQYSETFERGTVNDAMNILFIKGSNNYECSALSTPSEPIFADQCALRALSKAGLSDVVTKHCMGCEYKQVRERKNSAKHLITNYSYFFVDRMYSNQLEHRSITVWDECHTLNDMFVEHNAIYFSDERLKSFADEVNGALGIVDVSVAKTFKRMREAIKNREINETNYPIYLDELHTAYSAIAAGAERAAEDSAHDVHKYLRFKKMHRKYFGLGCKIDDLINYGYDHVYEFKEEENAISVKPVFIGAMFDTLDHSDCHLFMSATVTPEYMHQTIALDPTKTKFIKLPPTFPKENKKVTFFAPLYLNYASVKQPEIVRQINLRVEKITTTHAGQGHNGIVLTPSFDLTRQVSESLARRKDIALYEHRRGEKLVPVLEAFKKHKGKPAILVSPSLFEGISLDDDLCRFQIIVKAPFPSLGDKRIKYIVDHYEQIYSFVTTIKLIQGCGRGVRSMEDYCDTYMLDMGIQRLWNAPQNIWRDEFTTFYRRDIE